MLVKTLESPLDCKEIQPVHPKGNQSWIFIGRLMLKLKLWYFGLLMGRTDSFKKTLMLAKIKGRRRRGWQRMGLDGITDSMDMRVGLQKKAEGRRIDAFELWCWRRLFRVPWTARRSYQSILREINPENSLERLMPKLQYFGHLMQRANSLEMTLMLGKIEGRRRRGQQRMR